MSPSSYLSRDPRKYVVPSVTWSPVVYVDLNRISEGAGGGGGVGLAAGTGFPGAGLAVAGFRVDGAGFCPVGFWPVWPKACVDEQSNATSAAATTCLVLFIDTPVTGDCAESTPEITLGRARSNAASKFGNAEVV